MTRERSPSRPTAPETVHAWTATRFAGTAAAALFALDATLGDIVRTTREPIVGQMRLTWWHDALHALDTAPPPAHPVLADLAAQVLRHVPGAELAGMIDAWEILLDPDAPDDAALAEHGTARGGTLFAALAASGGGVADDTVRAAGAGWALADLAAGVSEAPLRSRAAALARARLDAALEPRWPRGARGAGALAVDARCAVLGAGDAGSPRRAIAVLRFRLTGR